MTKIKEVVADFEAFCPQQLAESWDHVGLQIGDLDQEITKMMVTLDVRPEVVQEAINQGVNFIFSHHPLLFTPVKTFDLSDPQCQMYAKLLKHNITVYAAHTNLDSVVGGMNDWVAAALGLEDVKILLPNATKTAGLGRVGKLKKPMSLTALIALCKDQLDTAGIRAITRNLNQTVETVALVAGSGSKFFPAAVKQGADVFITGDVTYHTGHDVLAADFSMLDVGHHIEAICKESLKNLFIKSRTKNDWTFDIIKSQVNTDPFVFV